MNPLFRSSKPHTRQRGSILVVSMVLAGLGTIGVAAWLSLLDARSHQVDANYEVTQRRIILENSRILAAQTFYNTLLHSASGLANDLTVSLPDGKGRAKINAYTTAPLLSNSVERSSRNGITPLDSYLVDVPVELSDGVGVERWTYHLRSTNPIAHGDLITLFPPARSTSANPLLMGKWVIKGRVSLWDALLTDSDKSVANGFQFPPTFGMSGQKINFRDSNGNSAIPQNIPYYPITTGSYRPVGASTAQPSYNGGREILSKTINPANSYETRLASSPMLLLSGSAVSVKTGGPSTLPANPDDPALLAYIASNPANKIVDALTPKNNLSSSVLMAALNKSGLSEMHWVKIMGAQLSPPEDALALMFSKIREFTITPEQDREIWTMLKRVNVEYVSNGRSQVTLAIGNPKIGHTRLTNTSWVRLIGQSDSIEKVEASKLSPMVLILDNRTGPLLSQTHLIDDNERPIILAAVGNASAPYQTNLTFSGGLAFPNWRIIFDMQDIGLLAMNDPSSNFKTIRGGILTNVQIIAASTGSPVHVLQDPNIGALAPLLSRVAWIEATPD